MSCCKTYDPCLDGKLNQIGSYASVARTSAQSAQASASSAAESAEAARFYLGSFAVAPTTNNEGGALEEGMIYYNTVSNGLFVWNGTIWASADFNEFTNFTATGTTTARNLVTRFADVVNVLDFGADPTGVINSTPSIQASVNSCGVKGLIYFPKGTYKLDSNVIVGSNIISYIINPEATFTGTGSINANSLGYGVYYDGSVKDTNLSLLKSDDKTGATALFAKYSTKGNSGALQNPSLYGLGYKFSTEIGARVQGVFGEGIDASGGNGSFVEGGRFHGICLNPSSGQNGVYGTINFAQSGANSINTNTSFVIGCESEVISFNTSGDAPTPRNFNFGRFNANFLATNRSGNKIDAAFIVNPYNDVSAEGGFIVSKGVGAQKTVESVAFGCYETNILYGIDLAKGSYSFAAISIPNNTPFRAYNAAGTFENNILYLGASNVLSIGVDVDIAHLESQSILPAANNTYTLGSSVPMAWANIYSQNPVTVISDLRLKKDIQDSVLGLDFINKLRPVSYKFIEGGNKVVERDERGKPTRFESVSGVRTHFGLIAQEVKEILPEGVDFGGWVIANPEDNNSTQALRYEQFIAPLIKAVQELSAKINK